MALKIRLRQLGRTNRQTYRIVVVDGRKRRDGKYLEMLGWYDPTQVDHNIVVHEERMEYWLRQGAQMSHNVKNLAQKVAPATVASLVARQHAKRMKMAAKRRKVQNSSKGLSNE